MKNYHLVSKYENIVNILEYISKLKCGEEVETNNEYFEIAQAWFSSVGRCLPKYLFVYNDDSSHEFFYHGHHEDKFVRKVATILSKSIDGLTGGEVQAYKMKVYIFGGEFSMGKGIWNEIFWEYDLNTEQLVDTKYGIPKRRHFKSCLVEDDLFIIGGTGPFRVRKNDMLWFNFATKKWREGAIPLPCCQTSIKYCNFKGQLFILDCPNRHGYIFNNDVTWKSVKISESVQTLMDECSSFSMFAYRKHLFFKGKRLLELELIDDKLDIKKLHDVPHYCDKILIDTLISNNRVYSLYTDQIHGDIRMQYLDLDNLKSIFIENVGLYYDSYIRNKNCIMEETAQNIDLNFSRYLKYNPNKMTKMFMFHDYGFCAFEDLLISSV